MPFCDQCGKEIRDSAKFCDGCGMGVGGIAPAKAQADAAPSRVDVDAAPAAPPATVRSARPKRGFIPLMIIGGAAVIVILVCGALFWRFIPGLNALFSKEGQRIVSQNDEAAAKANVPEGYAYIPPGEFMMGCSPRDDYCEDREKPAHRVRITKGFYMKTTEVTQGEYKSVMGNNPSYFTNCGDVCPVEKVTWQNARDYCKKTGGRLPTEAEWEYSARGGTAITGFYWGGGMDGDYAWYCDNSDDTTHPVGQKKPNGYGLFDMSGNVLEWVNDWFDANYYATYPSVNPRGPETGKFKVLRGGGYKILGKYARVSSRGGSRGHYDHGFRCIQDY